MGVTALRRLHQAANSVSRCVHGRCIADALVSSALCACLMWQLVSIAGQDAVSAFVFCDVCQSIARHATHRWPLTATPFHLAAVVEHLTIEDAWQFEQACQRLDLAFCQCTKADDKAQLMQTIKHSVGVKLMVRNLTEALIRASRSAMRFSDKLEDVALYCALLLKVRVCTVRQAVPAQSTAGDRCTGNHWHCTAHSHVSYICT